MNPSGPPLTPSQQHDADCRTLREAQATVDAATDRLIGHRDDREFWGPTLGRLRRAVGVLDRKLGEARPAPETGG